MSRQESRIIAMYAKGMLNCDIADHLRDIYGVEVSVSLISRITEREACPWGIRSCRSIGTAIAAAGNDIPDRISGWNCVQGTQGCRGHQQMRVLRARTRLQIVNEAK